MTSILVDRLQAYSPLHNDIGVENNDNELAASAPNGFTSTSTGFINGELDMDGGPWYLMVEQSNRAAR